LEAVEEICRRLDGLPLAIELAASRLRVLDPASLLERLAGRLDVVGGSVPDLPDRQRTLTSTIAWSYELLEPAERALFARLALFSGSRAPEAMAALDHDWENIHAVVLWRLARSELAPPVRLASLTWRYIWLYDRVREATTWMPLAYEARDQLEPALRGELCRI